MQDALLHAADSTASLRLPRGPYTARSHTAVVNGGAGYVRFSRNPHGYFYVESYSVDGQAALQSGLLFDMEKCASGTENLQAADPVHARYTDAVTIDGCVLSSFALHGETPEAVKQALASAWLVERRPA